MAGISISGLMSGLDTGAIVSQLMAVERAQARPIQQAQSRATSLNTALTDLNSAVKKMGDLARGFAPTSILDGSNFAATSVKSSDETIAKVTANGKAATADLTFTVDSVARASSTVSKNAFTLTETLGNNQAFSLNIGTAGKTTDITINAGATLTDVAEQINAAGAGVRATLLKVNDTQYALQVTAEKTGADSTVTIGGGGGVFDAGFQETVTGADTKITIGSGGPNPLTVTSSDRTIKDLVPGIDVTVLKESTSPVTITAGRDNETITKQADEFMKSVSAILSGISAGSQAGTASVSKDDTNWVNSAGVFMGNSTVRDLTQRLQNVLVGSSTNLPSSIGISIDRNGAATFDKAVFEKALADDPAKVEAVLAETAKQFRQVADDATDVTRGTLTNAIKGQADLVKDYGNRLSAFEDRLASTEARYKAKFDALDSMLSKMKSQSDWLTGQLNSLPSASSK